MYHRANRPEHYGASLAQTISNLSSTASALASSSAPNLPASTFAHLAHKHAHHLHNIPPREKSTRTLIIDHMLWVHGRTRFAQARAELGMNDRTGGVSSVNYEHRERPENYEEDDEHNSEGEDFSILKSRQSGLAKEDDVEAVFSQKQDLELARNLRIRAESLEKVIISMLDQRPPVHHPVDDLPSPTQLQDTRSKDDPHKLPNGVRLRLTLGTIINDMFARSAAPPPFRHHMPPLPIIILDVAESHSLPGSPVISATHAATAHVQPLWMANSHHIPSALLPLSTITAAPPESHLKCLKSIPSFSKITPTARVAALYAAGADPTVTTSSLESALCCPRHLQTGCQICVDARPGRRIGTRAQHSAAHDRINHLYATTKPDQKRARMNSGVTGWQDGSGVGSGLARPGVEGNILRRRSWSVVIDPASGISQSTEGTGSGNTKISELLPRLLRLSALVALELGSEAQEEAGIDSRSPPFNPLDRTREQEEKVRLHANALRPTIEWYTLLIGLITRAALEGYLTGGWRGTEAVECLLAVGLGMLNDVATDETQEHQVKEDMEVGDEFECYDPIALPSLRDAAKILFPAIQSGSSPGAAELEFQRELRERLQRFFNVPAQTPDLCTHMEDLAWHWPALPIERAALRFCEAVAKWRGKPELETYKSRPPFFETQTPSSVTNTHLPRTPMIYRYFANHLQTDHKRKRIGD